MKKDLTVKEVSFKPINPTNKGLVGFASCVYGNISLRAIAVYKRPSLKEYRLVFPTKQDPKGNNIPIFFPIDQKTNQLLTKKIINTIKLNKEIK